MNDTFFIARDVLHAAFGGNRRAVQQFETMQAQVADTEEAVTANVAETGSLKNAVFVTLSANAELPNERVLALGPGLSFDLAVPGVVRVDTSAYTTGGHDVQFSVTGPTVLSLPLTGTVATRAGTETLKNKTLDSPLVSGLANHADDAAAAAGGVPVGGLYRNGSAVQVRVA